MSYEIHAIHNDGDEPIVETGARYISAYEDRGGDGWVLSVDRKTHEGTLMSNDDLLEGPVPISPKEPFGDIMLDPGAVLWLKACWMTMLRTDLAAVEKLFEQAGECAIRRACAASGELN